MRVSIGEKIKTLREVHNLTQEQFGNIFHYSRTAICNYETGKRQPPFELLCNIAEYFNIDIAYFHDDNYIGNGNQVLIVSNNKTLLDITNLIPVLRMKIVITCLEYAEQSKKKQKNQKELIAR